MKKTIFSFVLPLVLTAVVTIFAYNMDSILYTDSNPRMVYADSGDEPASSRDVWANVGGMFNERGFSTSNSISYDENEVINNFNGNLQYSFPMYYFKGPGDMEMNLSLTYNGGIAHSVIAASPVVSQFLGPPLPQHTFNIPGWIFSVNGIAVQMMNFETNMLTQRDVNNKCTNDAINLLAVGYQLTDKKGDNDANPDYINILMGDGSLLTLVNEIANRDTGNYYASNSKDYATAKVVFSESIDPLLNPCRNRRITLEKGDGLIYEFEEERINYYDYEGIDLYNGQGTYNRPQVIKLNKIQDRFGNELFFDYEGQYSAKGRAKLNKIYTNTIAWPEFSDINFLYNPGQGGGNVRVQNSVKGEYWLTTGDYNLDSGGHQRPNITKIKNPLGQEIDIEYEYYTRLASNAAYNTQGTDLVELRMGDTDFDFMQRIRSITNYNGGKRKYKYKGGQSEGPLNFYIGPSFTAVVSGNNWGQGRDAFFNNMVDTVGYFDKDSTSGYKKVEYVYEFVDNDSAITVDPVDATDIYRTKRVETNLTTDIYDTPGRMEIAYHYRNYKKFDNYLNLENPDFSGEIVLEKQEHKKGSPAVVFKTMEYSSDKGPTVASQYYGYLYKGAFLDTLTKETIGSSVREVKTQYEHFSNYPHSGTSPLNPVKKKTEIDPFGNRVETEYIKLDGTSKFYYFGSYAIGGDYYDEKPFYLLNQPLHMRRTDSAGNLTAKTSYTYVMGNDSDTGYIGQLVSTKTYDALDTSIFKEIINSYNKKDSLGYYLYVGHGPRPGTEGNLKQVTDPNGNITKYYYNPIDSSEWTGLGTTTGTDEHGFPPEEEDSPSADYPMVAFWKGYDNGADSLKKMVWQDRRMPTRVDDYVNSTDYLTGYNLYNSAGNLAWNINDNHYLSAFTHDRLDRIENGVAPYDFAPYIDTTITDTSLVYEIVEVEANSFGAYDFKNDALLYYDNLSYATGTFKDNFKANVDHPGGPDNPTPPEYNTLKLPLVGYGDSLFSGYAVIDSAFVTLYPIQMDRSTGGDTILSKVNLLVQPLSQFWKGNLTPLQLTVNESVSEVQPFTDVPQQPGACSTAATFVENRFDITQLMRRHIIDEEELFRGLKFDLTYNVPGPGDPPSMDYLLDLGSLVDETCFTWEYWKDNFRPVVKVYGKKRKIRTYTLNTFSNATLKYEYADDSNKVRVLNKLENSRHRKTEHLFDGFYKLRENQIYTNDSTFNSLKTEYNYLDAKSKVTDAMGNQTKFSYDEYGEKAKTENTDNSTRLIANTYQTDLSYGFGTVSGMVNKKTFTDELGHVVERYYDAVGNLRRELVSRNRPGDSDPHRVTDYRYDSLYRVTDVKTPAGKTISYEYDGFGRQVSRTTPDAGEKKYLYDKADRIRFLQDANQTTPDVWIFRMYDGLSRVLVIGETGNGYSLPKWSELDPDSTYDFESYAQQPKNFLTINVYDTLSSAAVDTFSSKVPSGYYSVNNFTKGNVVATAYRTRGSDPWNYKFYRYDARGRVIKMWNTIYGLDTKVLEFEYNPQSQVEFMTCQDFVSGEFKKFRYTYDDAGRLVDVSNFVTSGGSDSTDASGIYSSFVDYRYNQNSLISRVNFENGGTNNATVFVYNNRNWVDYTGNDRFFYDASYYANGNVDTLKLYSAYNDSMASSIDLKFKYNYDESDWLIKADFLEPGGGGIDLSFNLDMTYDKDGNILTLQRYGASNNLVDSFAYDYITGTNKLKKVSGSLDQFTYDANGNVLKDDLTGPYDFKYDHRNLLLEFKSVEVENGDDWTRLYYDEVGNRVRKLTMRTSAKDPADPDWDNPGGDQTWTIVRDEYYVRDASGKEVMIYDGSQLRQWNVWGNGNEGRIKSNGQKNYYLKDHLGSIRAVLDESRNVISAQDYDPWGHLYEGRVYNSDTSTYKFTGKERDKNTGYDYFGARYYMSKIARWTSIDPLFEKHYDYSPYNYVLNNPLNLIDPDGRNGKRPTKYAPRGFDGWYTATPVGGRTFNNSRTRSLSTGGPVSKPGSTFSRRGSTWSTQRGSTDKMWPAANISKGKYFKHTKHSRIRFNEINKKSGEKLTTGKIDEVLSTGRLFVGHKGSGALTFIGRQTFRGKNLVVGFNPLTKKVTTVMNPRDYNTKPLTEVGKVLGEVFRQTIKNIGIK